MPVKSDLTKCEQCLCVSELETPVGWTKTGERREQEGLGQRQHCTHVNLAISFIADTKHWITNIISFTEWNDILVPFE